MALKIKDLDIFKTVDQAQEEEKRRQERENAANRAAAEAKKQQEREKREKLLSYLQDPNMPTGVKASDYLDRLSATGKMDADTKAFYDAERKSKGEDPTLNYTEKLADQVAYGYNSDQELYDEGFTIEKWYQEYQLGNVPYDARKLEVYNRKMNAQHAQQVGQDVGNQKVELKDMTIYDSMTAYEKGLLRVYMEQRETTGALNAQKYLDGKYGEGTTKNLAETVTRHENAKRAQETQKYAAEHTAHGDALLAIPGRAIVTPVLGAADQLGQYIAGKVGATTGRYEGLDPYSAGQLPGIYADAVIAEEGKNFVGAMEAVAKNNFSDERVAETVGKAANVVYNAGVSALENLTRIAVTGGFGSLALAGTAGFSQAVREATLNGASADQAMAMGLVSGASEILTEKIPLDNLLGALSKAGSAQSFKNIVAGALKQAGIEVATEELNFIVGLAGEALILQEKSGYNQMVAQLTAQGVSYAEAVSRANKALIQEAGQIALQSGLSAIMMSAGTNVATQLGSSQFTDTAQEYEGQKEKVSDGLEWLHKVVDNLYAKKAAQDKTGAEGAQGGAVDPTELIDGVIAKLNNAPADPVGTAVESFETTGTVSNKQASDILNSTKAVQQLVKEGGLPKLEGMTAVQKRQAVKDAVQRMAEQKAANTVEEQNRTDDSANESRRLTDSDIDDYMLTGDRLHVRDTKQRIVNNGESPILTKPEEIVAFIRDAFRRKVQKVVKGYGRVNNRLANAVKTVSNGQINIDDYYLELDADKIAHISDHVVQDKDTRNIPLTEEQLEQLPQYIDTYDDLVKIIKRKDGSVRLMLGKKINGHSIIVETVSKGRKSLHPVTAYQIDSADYERYYKTRAIDRSSTSRSASADTVDISRQAIAPKTIIPNDGQSVNTENGAVGAAEAGFSGDLYRQIYEYGNIPEGENAVRPDVLPKSTDGTDRVSYTARTALEAQATSDPFANVIVNATQRGGLSYIPITNSETVEQAKAEIEEKGWEDAKKDWETAVKAGESSPQLTAIGALLYNNAVNSGKYKTALDILTDYTLMVRNSAQALQAARILKTLTPENRLYMIDATVKKLDKKINPDRHMRRVTDQDNVHVEQWMQKTGEKLAEALKKKVTPKDAKVDTVAQTILKDLRRIANETVETAQGGKLKRSEMDMIRDMVMNRSYYEEALAAAKETIQKEYGENKEVLQALEKWMETKFRPDAMFAKATTGSDEIAISEELITEYMEAETEEARNEVIKKIQKQVAAQLPSSFMEKVTAFRYVNMLGNFRTQLRNVVGNATMTGVRALHNATAAGLENVAHKLSGGKLKRTRSATVSRAQMDAAGKDFDTVENMILDGGKFNDTDISDEFLKGVEKERRIFKFAPLEGYRKVTNWAMEKGDIVFAKHAYARALAGYLKANGITETDYSRIDTAIMDDARLFAAKEAQEATFRDTNWLSGWVSKIGRRKDTPAVGKLISEGVVPFRKTPANVFARAWEYSPLGVINSAYTSIKAMGKDSEITGTQIINSWAKTLTGSGIFLLGMLLQSVGLLSTGPDEDEKKEGFEDLNGWQNYAFTLPDGTNITIDSLTPSAIPLLMGAEMKKLIDENGFQLKDLEKALTSITQPMIEMSMLQGVNDTLDNIQYAESNLGQLLINSAVSYLTQGVTNTLFGQIERTFEDSRMTTYVDKDSELPDWLQKALGKASAKVHGWDYNQIPYINAWGEEEKNPAWAINGAYNLFSPSYIEKGISNDVTQELNRLNEVQSDVNVYPSRPEKTVTVNKKDYNLSAEEYVALAKKQGQTQKKLVEDLIASADYARLSDDEKAKAIGFAYEYAKGKAKGEVIPDHPGISAKWMKNLTGNIADGIIRYVAAGTTEKYNGVSIEAADYISGILDSLTKETKPDGSQYANVRDVQKLEAVVNAEKLTDKEQDSVLRDIMGDSLEAKYDKALAIGISADDFVEAYRKQTDTKGKGAKDEVILYFVKDLGLKEATAETLYKIYAGTDEK